MYRIKVLEHQGKKYFYTTLVCVVDDPDLVLEFKNGKIVYIELKTKKGTLFSSQKAWLEKVINSKLHITF